jgi:recombination protein RecA
VPTDLALFDKWVAESQRADPGSMFKLDDDAASVLQAEVIPTGVISLDVALGVGGLPRGRIIEIYGPEQSGKSALSMSVCANAHKLGGTVGYIDAEHAFDPMWAQTAFGMDRARTVVAQPDDGIKALRMVQRMCESNVFDVIVIDSVAALLPPAMAEAEIGEANQLGQHAKLMSDGLRKLVPVVAESNAVVIFINQIRMNPGAYGNPETTTGGKALKFYSSMRIEVRAPASKRYTVDKEVVGQRCEVKVPKNKLAPPYRTCAYDLYYRTGISSGGALLEAAEGLGVILRGGSSYTEVATGERIAVGKEATKAAIDADAELAKRLTQAIYQALDAGRATVADTLDAAEAAEDVASDTDTDVDDDALQPA